MMKFRHIAIIGIGLIGSSLALALKKNGFKGTLTGIGRREGNLRQARELGIIDQLSTNHAEGIRNADLIVLASSVSEFEHIANNIRDSIKPGTIVTDVGSVKGRIVQILDAIMPDGVHFVGGHPIAGKECPGIESATPDLFDNAKCILTPTRATDQTALAQIRNLWESIGSNVIIMSPEQHDAIFASVSHMPHVVAYALVNAVADNDVSIINYGGKGFRDMTRIALSPSRLWRDICAYNRDEVLEVLKKFSSSLLHLLEIFERSDWDALEKEFKRAKEARGLIESD